MSNDICDCNSKYPISDKHVYISEKYKIVTCIDIFQ